MCRKCKHIYWICRCHSYVQPTNFKDGKWKIMHTCRTMVLTDHTKPDIISFCQVSINGDVETYKLKGFLPNVHMKPMPSTLKAKQGKILLDKILEKNGIESKSYRITKWSQSYFGAKVTMEPSREFMQEIWNRHLS